MQRPLSNRILYATLKNETFSSTDNAMTSLAVTLEAKLVEKFTFSA
jgi:hypothetical protein